MQSTATPTPTVYSQHQQNIFNWIERGEGNAIAIARAGSGKTFTALHGMAKMSGSIISMTFNKKNAVELEEKVKAMGISNCKAATFHAEGFFNLKNTFGRMKVNNSKVYYITDSQLVGKEERKCLQFVLKMVSLAKQAGFGIEGLPAINDDKAWMDLYAHHDISFDADIEMGAILDVCKQVLNTSNRDTKEIDFDDMVYLPILLNIPITKYDWVIVDEAQDTNAVRKLIAQRMLKPTSRFLAIGDDKQAIYGFTGAENDSMNIIKEAFNCQEFALPICYRCGNNIIKEAQYLVPDIQAKDNAIDGIVTSIKYEDFAYNIASYKLNDNDGIICRNNAPLISLAFRIIRQGVGCRIEGRDIGKSLASLCSKWKEITDINAFTKKLVEYFDKEFSRASRTKMQMLEDKMQCMIVLIERAQEINLTTTWELAKLIDSMFSDYGDKGLPRVVTLSSIHKAKGLEWKRCFNLGNRDFMPNKFAVMDWQQEQEKNLEYVAITRAMNELVYITNVPTRNNSTND